MWHKVLMTKPGEKQRTKMRTWTTSNGDVYIQIMRDSCCSVSSLWVDEWVPQVHGEQWNWDGKSQSSDKQRGVFMTPWGDVNALLGRVTPWINHTDRLNPIVSSGGGGGGPRRPLAGRIVITSDLSRGVRQLLCSWRLQSIDDDVTAAAGRQNHFYAAHVQYCK